MPTKKIENKDLRFNWDFRECSHPEHNPPSMRVFDPGLYEHECPSCGKKQCFRIDATSLRS